MSEKQKYGLTKEALDANVKSVEYVRYGDTGTLCVITLPNGYTVTGTSSCIDPAGFDPVIGEKVAFDNAFEKLWATLGYGEKQRWYEETQLDWRERAKIEFRQLGERLIKLRAVLLREDGGYNDKPAFISDEQWDLMKAQHSAMEDYFAVLATRIDKE